MSEQATSVQQKTVASVPNAAHEGVLQRKCACGQHTVAGGECETCRKKHGGLLQRAAVNTAPVTDVPPVVNEVLSSPGQPLDAGTRTFMESRFGQDFSHVRVHTDETAAVSARSVNALAYTVGKDVVFGAGHYAPETTPGQRLLAHELTHVLQQRHAPAGRLQLAGGPTNAPLEHEADRVSERIMRPTGDRASTTLIGPIAQSPMILSRKEGEETSAGDVDQVQEEAKVDARRIRSIFVDNSFYLDSGNQRDIMAIVQKWANKPMSVTRTRVTSFDLFIVALGNASFDVGHVVSQNTNAFDQLYRRMDKEYVEQIKTWVRIRGQTFRDAQPNPEVKFEVSKQDVIEAVKTTAEVGGAVVEVAGAGLTGGASELAIIALWLVRTLPGLYEKVKAVTDFVQALRSVKLDDIKNLITAVGIGNMLVKALFGEVQGLPTVGKEEQGEKEPDQAREERGLIKLFHDVMRVIKVLQKIYNKVAEFVNRILSTINITTKEWFKPFSMVYAAVVDAVEVASNPGAVLGTAVAKVREMAGTFFDGLKKHVEETMEEIKTQVANIGNPVYLLSKLADKAVEMVLNFIVTNPPSPAIKLTFRIIEAVSKQSIIDLVRQHIPYADELIKKIASSSVVQKVMSPLKEPIASVTGAITNVSTKATQVIDDSRGKVESLVGDGVQMVKELTGIDPVQPKPAKAADQTEAEEKKAPRPTPSAGSLKDFLGVVKHGIHTHLLAMGEQFLVQSGKALGKAALKKATEGAKSLAGKLLGKKLGFDVGKEHHELWAEEEREDVALYMESKKTAIDKKIELYNKVFSELKDQGAKKKAEKLIPQLAALNKKAQSLRKKEDAKALETTEQQMIPLVEQLEQLMPATEFKTEFVVPSGATVRLTRDFIILVCDGTSCKEIDTYKNHRNKMKGVGDALNAHHLLEKRFLDSLDQLRRQRGIPPLNVNEDDVNSVVLPSRGKDLDDLIKHYPAAQALKEIPSRHLRTPKLEKDKPDAPLLSVSGELQGAVSGIRNVKGKKYAGAVTAGEIFEVHRDLYTDMGRPSWIQAIKGYFKGLL